MSYISWFRTVPKKLPGRGFESLTHYMKYKHGTKEYWKDWYWNKGGREKVQARRTSEEGRLKEKLQRLKREGLDVVKELIEKL